MAVKTVIQVRRDTALQWSQTNPTLAPGEIGFETDTGKFKICPGTVATAWNSIAAYANPTQVVQSVVAPLSLSGTALSVSGGLARFTGSTDTLSVTNPYPKVTVKSGSTGPASPTVGDVWIKYV
jgi:hypothetical protein